MRDVFWGCRGGARSLGSRRKMWLNKIKLKRKWTTRGIGSVIPQFSLNLRIPIFSSSEKK